LPLRLVRPEAGREGAQAADDPDEKQGRDQDLAPSVALGKDAEHGDQRDVGQGEDGDQEHPCPLVTPKASLIPGSTG